MLVMVAWSCEMQMTESTVTGMEHSSALESLLASSSTVLICVGKQKLHSWLMQLSPARSPSTFLILTTEKPQLVYVIAYLHILIYKVCFIRTCFFLYSFKLIN